MKVIFYLNDVGICKARKSLVFTDHPCVLLVRAVTVPPATGHTFLNAVFRSFTHDIIQPDFTCRDMDLYQPGQLTTGDSETDFQI